MSSIRTQREERAEGNRIPVFGLLRAAWRLLSDRFRSRKSDVPRMFAGPDAERRRTR